MKRHVAAFFLVALLSSCATIDTVPNENRRLLFDCDESVVVGRVSNQRVEEQADVEGALITHSWMAADLKVQRRVRGPEVPSTLSVRYYAHTFMRDDRDFMFILSRGDAGYEIEHGQLMSVRPYAVSSCVEK